MRGKKTLIPPLVILLLPVFSGASVIFDTSLPSARSAGIGGAITAFGGYAPVLWKNPAGVSGIQGFQFVAAQTQKFSLSELSRTNISAAFPTKIGSMGLGYFQAGGGAYKEAVFSVVYAKTVLPSTEFGFGLKTMNLAIDEYGSATAGGIDIGVQNNISPALTMGFSLSNANSPFLGVSRIPVRKNLSFGLNYKPASDVSLLGELEKIEGHDIATKMAFEYLIAPGVYFRSGLRSGPARFSFGLGFSPARFLIDYAFVTHPVLPAQHFFSLGVDFGGGGSAAEATGGVKRFRGGKIAVNKATAEELAQLSHAMGMVTAQRIVKYRDERGPFKNIDDLKKVPRLREATIRSIQTYITFEDIPAKEEKISAVGDVKSTPREEQYGQEPEVKKVTDYKPPSQRKIDRRMKKSGTDENTVPPPAPTPAATVAPSLADTASDEDSLDINSATEQELQVVGFTSAQAKNIIRFRKRTGGFSSVDDLLNVPGITKDVFGKCREHLKCVKPEKR